MHKRLIILALALTALTATAALAARVEVAVPLDENATRVEFHQRTLDEGFAEAAAMEAERLLPGPIGPERRELLKEHLAETAGDYVLGYGEVSRRTTDEDEVLVLDVEVNRQALRETLQDMGVYYTATQRRGVTLRLAGEPLTPEEQERLAGLLVLSGLERVANADTTLDISKGLEGRFQGRLEGPERIWSGTDADLGRLWFTLWGRYFAQRDVQDGGIGNERLTVSGWFTPDGVGDFDEELRSWDEAVQDVRLVDLDVQVSRVQAVWHLRVVDTAALRARLQAYLPARGLVFAVAAAEDADAPGQDAPGQAPSGQDSGATAPTGQGG